jgi:phosphate starvation-inducible PhoH-like protein
MPKKKYEAPVAAKPAPEKQLFSRKIVAKNYTQELYMQHLREDPIIFGQGPAGSGKTFIATAIACEKLVANEVSKIVLTRPVVESGEKLGFLPGTLEEKIHPYLLPLLDGLNSHLGPKKVQDLMMEGKIEVAPLAYMRGRTFDNCYVILDEAENTTKDQMKLFLTRIGFNTTMAVNGDHTQTDLDKRIENGLTWAVRKLRGRESDISVIEFSKSDIVRSPLIGKLLTHLESPDGKEFKPQLLQG